MRHASFLAIILTFVLAASAFASDGNVPRSTLESLGLAGMQTVSDQEGMQVRGMGAAAVTMGRSLVTGLLIDPNTNSYAFGTDVNAASACMETTCFLTAVDPYHVTSSSVNLSLSVSSPMGSFSGVLTGGAGGSGRAWSR